MKGLVDENLSLCSAIWRRELPELGVQLLKGLADENLSLSYFSDVQGEVHLGEICDQISRSTSIAECEVP